METTAGVSGGGSTNNDNIDVLSWGGEGDGHKGMTREYSTALGEPSAVFIITLQRAVENELQNSLSQCDCMCRTSVISA